MAAPTAALAADGGEGAPAEAQRRAAIMADLGRLRLELGTPDDLRGALAALDEASRLDPACITARFWHGAALLRSAADGGGRFDAERVGAAGLEFEAVFKLSLLDRSPGAQDLRRRAIAMLDACAGRLPPDEKRFEPWWKARREQLLAERPQSDLVHVVGPRETLSGLARRYYGNPDEADRIAATNPGIDPRRLTVGQRLTVPGVPLEVPRPEPALGAEDAALVVRLRSADGAADRRIAAERLAVRDCAAGAPALVDALRTDPSQWVRAECARSLGRLGDASAEPVLAAALASDGSARCRTEAALALGRVGGRGAAIALLRGLSDSGYSVAAASAESLGRLRVAEASGPLTAALSSPSEAVRRAAALALRELAVAGSLAAPDLEGLRRAAGGSSAAGPGALLVACGADRAGAARMLAAALASNSQEVRRAACEAATDLAASGALDGDTAALLAPLLDSRDPAERLGAAAALARAGAAEGGNRAALGALVTLLGETRPVWWGAGEARPAAECALQELRGATGATLGGEAEGWKRWLENRR